MFLVVTRALCLLDSLPRYGRIYTLPSRAGLPTLVESPSLPDLPELPAELARPSERLRRRHTWVVRWEWRRPGFWGMSLMTKLKLEETYWGLMLTEVDDEEEDYYPEDEEHGDDVSPAAQ